MLNINIPYFENLSTFYEAINVPKPIHEHFDVRYIQENMKTVKCQNREIFEHDVQRINDKSSFIR